MLPGGGGYKHVSGQVKKCALLTLFGYWIHASIYVCIYERVCVGGNCKKNIIDSFKNFGYACDPLVCTETRVIYRKNYYF